MKGVLKVLYCLAAYHVLSMPSTLASPAPVGPRVSLSQGKLYGTTNATTGLDMFLGVPFAKPPVGELRFAKPQPLEASNKIVEATSFGPSCLQAPNENITAISEDCLTINIIRPAGIKPGAKLPVLHWTYGGSFLAGGSSSVEGAGLVQKSVELGRPIIFASSNYRVGSFGFIGGAEIDKDSSATVNAGLYDQRMAFSWLHHNIRAFGGDPKKVTIAGQSAGSISVALQTTANDGNPENLFRAAIMHSGVVPFATTLSARHPTVQDSFDKLASAVGCAPGQHSLNSTVECLRQVDATAINEASLVLSARAESPTPPVGYLTWLPLMDDFFLKESATKLIKQGKVADIPMIAGTVLDEGTLFGNKMLNNTQQFEAWFRSLSVARNSSNVDEVLKRVFELYPDIPAQLAPYPNAETATSQATAASDQRFFEPLDSNQARRTFSIFGDTVFDAPRRNFVRVLTSLKKRHNAKRMWSYNFRQVDPSPQAEVLGAYHSSDLAYLFAPFSKENPEVSDVGLRDTIQTSWISFINDLDPNSIMDIGWPAYHEEQKLLQLKGQNTTLIDDDFRTEQLEFLLSPKAARVFSI